MEPTKTISFEGRDGQSLQGYAWLPEGDEAGWKGVLQIAHGLAEHALRYGRLAAVFNEAGFAVYAHDHRGHGQSATTGDDLGFFAGNEGWSLVVHDMFAMNNLIATAHPSLPRILLGHSMGSFLTQQYISEHGDSVVGAVLSASIDDAGFLRKLGVLAAKFERWRMGQRGKSKLLNAMSFGDYNKPFKPNRTEFDWLSRDPAEVDKYVADPLCGFIASTQLWLDLLGGLGELAKPSTRSRVPNALPLYLLTGTKDPVTNFGKAVDGLAKAYKAAGSQDVTVKQYPDARHECFNETNRDEVTSDLLAWCERVATDTASA